MVGDDTGRIVGAGLAGPCNHVAAPEAQAKLLRVLTECVGEACAQAGLPVTVAFEACCMGFSGGAADKEAVVARATRSAKLLVTDDAVIALSGAMAGEPGVVTIAGTGSITLGRNAEHRIARAGGWGYVFGDEGSAFDIVRQCLRAALRHAEGWGGATLLSEMFLRETGAADLNAVLHLFYTPDWPRSRVAQLATLVDLIARDGDSLAQQILDNAARQLAALATAVKNQLWSGEQAVKAAYIGGVFNSGLMLTAFIEACEANGFDVGIPMLPPACGALLEAYRLVGRFPDPRKLVISNFRPWQNYPSET